MLVQWIRMPWQRRGAHLTLHKGVIGVSTDGQAHEMRRWVHQWVRTKMGISAQLMQVVQCTTSPMTVSSCSLCLQHVGSSTPNPITAAPPAHTGTHAHTILMTAHALLAIPSCFGGTSYQPRMCSRGFAVCTDGADADPPSICRLIPRILPGAVHVVIHATRPACQVSNAVGGVGCLMLDLRGEPSTNNAARSLCIHHSSSRHSAPYSWS